jgi:DNA-binding CsgD family transcriptional regulator
MVKFTNKELEVMKYLCLDNKDIAKRLRVKPSTVNVHLNHIRQKTGTSTKASAIVELLRANLVDINEIITN